MWSEEPSPPNSHSCLSSLLETCKKRFCPPVSHLVVGVLHFISTSPPPPNPSPILHLMAHLHLSSMHLVLTQLLSAGKGYTCLKQHQRQLMLWFLLNAHPPENKAGDTTKAFLEFTQRAFFLSTRSKWRTESNNYGGKRDNQSDWIRRWFHGTDGIIFLCH